MLQICVTKKKINEFEFENIILDKVFLHCVPYRVCQQSCSFSLRICFAFVSCSCCWRWRCCCLCRCRLPTDLLLDFSLVQKIFSRCAVVWSGKLKFAFKLLKGFTVYCFHSFVRSHVRSSVRTSVFGSFVCWRIVDFNCERSGSRAAAAASSQRRNCRLLCLVLFDSEVGSIKRGNNKFLMNAI